MISLRILHFAPLEYFLPRRLCDKLSPTLSLMNHSFHLVKGQTQIDQETWPANRCESLSDHHCVLEIFTQPSHWSVTADTGLWLADDNTTHYCKQAWDLISDVGGTRGSFAPQYPTCSTCTLLLQNRYVSVNTDKLTWRIFWVVLMDSCKQ